ncbi:TetR/AcrR family transcriptional regulator [Gordonia sp. (in: high G+C Gram-positive bacteria)]|uniref:TetR/AcrR family transcriptional regulator n=1 Tax=Gordonia sp. (in: high G+C Gram-positive bacteria) TaxID=84139 RepID=UPI00262F4D3C|nr:TetR/AcrR family transcriptional regulator [Gordonia sp. (in: high G+C Gram-positive bacteria)]
MDATLDCLVEFGYAGTTTSRVSERAGVTRGAQLHHFGSRPVLVSAAVRHLAARRSAEAIEEAGRIADAADPLSAMFDLLWDLHDGPLFTAAVELWVAGRSDPELGAEVITFERIVNQSVVAALAGALPAGAEVDRRLPDFVYTAMDALRGIKIAAFVDADSLRARRRWDRACDVLRRGADPAMFTWLGAAAD